MTKTIGHTPGPWTFFEGNQQRREMSRVTKADDADFLIGYVITESQQKEQRAEDIANARLIAAAPQLLAACKDVLGLVESEGRDTGCGGPFSDLREAIENAEGR